MSLPFRTYCLQTYMLGLIYVCEKGYSENLLLFSQQAYSDGRTASGGFGPPARGFVERI